MQITLNRSHCPVFVRHPLPWRVNSPRADRLQYTQELRDAAGNLIAESQMLPLRYHRILDLYNFCVPSAVAAMYPGAAPHEIREVVDYFPVVLRKHPLPWWLVKLPAPAFGSVMWDGDYGTVYAQDPAAVAMPIWAIVDADSQVVGNQWSEDSNDAGVNMLVFELAKLAEDTLFRRDRGFRVVV
jgi:hypothetical protein